MKMKKLVAVLLLLSCGAFPACASDPEAGNTRVTTSAAPDTTEVLSEIDTTVTDTETVAPTLYYVRTPKQPAETELQTKVYTFEDYDRALAHATKPQIAVLGYAVYDEEGNFLGGKYDELVTNLMYNGKHVTDYIKMNGYKYGNAGVHPAITYMRRLHGRDNGEQLISCDRLVDWILYDTGFSDQPQQMGMHINAYMDPRHGMLGWCIAQGFEKIENPRDLQAGDLVFTNPKSDNPDFPQHVYMFAGECDRSGRGIYYRYDAGSDDRILCRGQYAAYNGSGQPFKESVGSFVVAYRPVESALKKPLGE